MACLTSRARSALTSCSPPRRLMESLAPAQIALMGAISPRHPSALSSESPASRRPATTLAGNTNKSGLSQNVHPIIRRVTVPVRRVGGVLCAGGAGRLQGRRGHRSAVVCALRVRVVARQPRYLAGRRTEGRSPATHRRVVRTACSTHERSAVNPALKSSPCMAVAATRSRPGDSKVGAASSYNVPWGAGSAAVNLIGL